MEYRLYGLPENETDSYMEVLLISRVGNIGAIKKVQRAAEEKGFHSFRVATYNGEAPDFIGTINTLQGEVK